MKYPQLVSTRAVNAISDWLVSQLEQLGVEAPLIYSRLLLSLLHRSVQINDPTEFSDLEAYLSNRKGNKRNPPCDTNTLKKLTAVQCLMETVSSEQEVTKIENLIEELCEKLNDIENNQDKNELIKIEDIYHPIEATSSSPKSDLKSNEIEDPRKRYYRAFPALSKEMEDSVWIAKKNIKSLTWPTNNHNHNNNVIVTNVAVNNNNNNNNSIPNVVNSQNNTAGVKRKPKRQRNQAMSKGRMRFTRKNSYGGGGINRNNNNSSPIWDTDFEGSWEMDHDLIKEFITKQNNRNRRSTSESETCNIRRSEQQQQQQQLEANEFFDKSIISASIGGNDDDDNDDFYNPSIFSKSMKNKNEISSSKISKLDNTVIMNLETTLLNDELSISSADNLLQQQQNEISIPHNAFINDEGYSSTNNDATLTASISEITTSDGILSSARRLYERDVSNDSLNMLGSLSEQNDFAQFKAKFNSSVEALWKSGNDNNDGNNNSNNDGATGDNDNIEIINQNAGTLPCLSSSSSSSSLKHKNLDNFWTNYYNHHYDTEKMNVNTRYNSDGGTDTAANTDETDFFSMPISFDSKSNSRKTITIENNFVSSGVFLQNSIWSSDNLSSSLKNDESNFYTNVLGSSYKNESKIDSNLYDTDNTTGGPYSFTISKWSECSFETPFIPSSSSASSSIDATLLNKSDLRENMLKNSYLYNYKQSFAPSTSSSNNLSNNTITKNTSITYHHHNQHQHQQSSSSDICGLSTKTKITLKNHSLHSGFIEYSRIKSILNNNSGLKKPIASKTENICCNNLSTIISSSTSPISSISSGCCGGGGNGSGSVGNDDNGDDSTENLLTSDRTHFRPIKQNYADGYEFDIPNNLDEISFERSKSGYLLFESDKYLEYTRFDTFLSDEDQHQQQQTSMMFSSSSTSTSASVSKITGKESNINKIKRKDEFSLKFRIKKTNKFCQTENLILSMEKHIKEKENSVVNKTFDSIINNNRNKYTSKIENNDITNTDSENDSSSLDNNKNNRNSSYYLKDDSEASINLEQWSMVEIGKKCCNQNSNHNIHTLWGMCQACNNNNKMNSLPANRLLKDELNLEADEIMSDLKYMQDLYIGSCVNNGGRRNRNRNTNCESRNDWDENDDIIDEDLNDDEGDNDDYDDDDDENDDTDYDTEMLKECELYETMVLETLSEIDDEKHNKKQKQENDDDIYYDVTKFISDLLKPENAKSLANALGATTRKICTNTNNKQQYTTNNTILLLNDDDDDDEEMGLNNNNNNVNMKNNNLNNERYIGGLWSNENDLENMIWKQEQKQEQQQNNNDEIFTKDIQEKNSFLEKFGNWKYSNLANLWKTTNNNSTFNDKTTNNFHQNEKNISSSLSSTTTSSFNKNHVKDHMKNLKNLISMDGILYHSKEQYKFPITIPSTITTNIQLKTLNKQQSLPSKIENDDTINSTTFTTLIPQTVIMNKKSLGNRKRRHSASSQNVDLLERIYCNNMNNDDGNNNNKYYNRRSASDFCNNIFVKNKVGIFDSKIYDYDDDLENNDDNDDGYNNDKLTTTTTATIITCKYWTTTASTEKAAKTFFSTAATNENLIHDNCNLHFGDGITTATTTTTTALVLNPSSILKQVAMVTRPLTR